MHKQSETEFIQPVYYSFSDFSLTLVTRSNDCHAMMRRLTHFRPTDHPSEQNITICFQEKANLDVFFAPMPSSVKLLYEIKPDRAGDRGIQVYQQDVQVRWIRFPGFGGIAVNYVSRTIASCFVSEVRPDDLVPFIFFIIQPLTRMVSCFAYHFLHAATLSVCGHGILITGLSGRGKSTATMALVDGGHVALTDEYTFIKKEKDEFFAYSMMDWIKISPVAQNRFFRHRQSRGLFCEADHVYRLSQINPHPIKQPVKISHLFILSQSGQHDTRIQSAISLDVIPELLPVSISIFDQVQQKGQFELFTDFLNTVRCYRVSFGTDMDRFVSAVEQTVQKEENKI